MSEISYERKGKGGREGGREGGSVKARGSGAWGEKKEEEN